MLVQRRRRWTNINPALVQRLAFSEFVHLMYDGLSVSRLGCNPSQHGTSNIPGSRPVIQILSILFRQLGQPQICCMSFCYLLGGMMLFFKAFLHMAITLWIRYAGPTLAYCVRLKDFVYLVNDEHVSLEKVFDIFIMWVIFLTPLSAEPSLDVRIWLLKTSNSGV